MAGQSRDIGIGSDNGGGPLSTGGPLGGPGRPGTRLVTAQQDQGDFTGPGVPTTPLRGVPGSQSQRAKGSPKNPNMAEGR
jgi:hypothetical protein